MNSSQKRIRIFVTIIIVAFIFGILFGDRGLMKIFDTYRETEKIENMIARMATEKSSLEERIKQLEKGGIHLERYAREQLGLIAEDEIVYEFRNKKATQR